MYMQTHSPIGDPAVYQRLKLLDIEYEYHEHPPAPTIEEAMKYWRNIPSWHCKNLFFRNHKGNQHFLVLIEGHTQLNIRALEQLLKQGKLTFASPKRMQRYLGVNPGSVSPFGLVHDDEHHVRLFLDESLRQADRIAFHPNDNKASLVISGKDFVKFLNSTQNQWEYLPLAEETGGNQYA